MKKLVQGQFYGLFLITSLLMARPAFAQLKTAGFEQLDSLQKIDKKPVVVFLHTSWCKYCAMMMNTAFEDKEVITTLNEKFHLVFFNPEEKKNILFRNTLFKYQSTGLNTSMNELALRLALIDGQLMYPSICILNPGYQIIYQHAGFLRTKEFLKILDTLAK